MRQQSTAGGFHWGETVQQSGSLPFDISFKAGKVMSWPLWRILCSILFHPCMDNATVELEMGIWRKFPPWLPPPSQMSSFCFPVFAFRLQHWPWIAYMAITVVQTCFCPPPLRTWHLASIFPCYHVIFIIIFTDLCMSHSGHVPSHSFICTDPAPDPAGCTWLCLLCIRPPGTSPSKFSCWFIMWR